LLAHGLGIEEQTVERCEALVLRISKMLYRQSLLPKIVREAIVGDYDKPMLEVLNDVFSDKTFMDVATKSPKVRQRFAHVPLFNILCWVVGDDRHE